MIFLRENGLVEEAITHDHIKKRLLGHWGSQSRASPPSLVCPALARRADVRSLLASIPHPLACPGLTFVYAHANVLINNALDKECVLPSSLLPRPLGMATFAAPTR